MLSALGGKVGCWEQAGDLKLWLECVIIIIFFFIFALSAQAGLWAA
jgi:hypothetical protein